MLNTPILLITFNRPDHTRQVLERILEAQPKELYVFQDGARSLTPAPSPEGEGRVEHPDVAKCQQVRDVVAELVGYDQLSTGQHTLHTPHFTLHFYGSPVNLGCGPGPMTALNWFFSENEMGIILEDDAVPHLDFFGYAAELLMKYKDDLSVRAIGSMNIDSHPWGDGSYYFSMMNRNLCAWATWKRAWNDFDLYLRDTGWQILDKALKRYGCGFYEREYWLDRLAEAQKDGQGGKSWDMQFFMSIWLHGGKGIIPNVNISSNIGTVGEATHQMGEGNVIDNIPTKPILPLIHPNSTDIQSGADREFHKLYFENYASKLSWIVVKVNKRLKRITGHKGSWIKKR